MKKALIHETFDARELSMLLMAWALAVAGRFFSGVAFHISGFPTVALRYGIFPVGVRPHSGMRRYLAATR